MLDMPCNLKLYKLYVSILDTKARVLDQARQGMWSKYSHANLLEEVKRLDQLREKLDKLVDWSA